MNTIMQVDNSVANLSSLEDCESLKHSKKLCLEKIHDFLSKNLYRDLFTFLELNYPMILNDNPLIRLCLMEMNLYNSILNMKSMDLEWDPIKTMLDDLFSYLKNFMSFDVVSNSILLTITTQDIINSQFLRYKFEEHKFFFLKYVEILLEKHTSLIILGQSLNEEDKISSLISIKEILIKENTYNKKLLWFAREVEEFYNKYIEMNYNYDLYYEFEKYKSCSSLKVSNFDSFMNFYEIKQTDPSQLLRDNDSNLKLQGVTKNIFSIEKIKVGGNSNLMDTDDQAVECNNSVQNEGVTMAKVEKNESMNESDSDSRDSEDNDQQDEEMSHFSQENNQNHNLHENRQEINKPFIIQKVQSNNPTPNFKLDAQAIISKKQIKDKIAFRSISFEFTKRENIDKTVMRKFRKFVMTKIKSKTADLDAFWKDFCIFTYLPPFKTEDIEFRSFCTNYLLWVFSHPGGKELYESFIDKNLNELLQIFTDKYKTNNTGDLKEYLINLGDVFSSGNGENTAELLAGIKRSNAGNNQNLKDSKGILKKLQLSYRPIPQKLLSNLTEYRQNLKATATQDDQYQKLLQFFQPQANDTSLGQDQAQPDLNIAQICNTDNLQQP